jgi:phage major head subunit gpT-like protein
MATPKFLVNGIRLGFAQQWRAMDNQSGAPGSLMSSALMTTSNSREENYGWLASMPAVQEFLGEVDFGQLNNYDFTLRNRDWAAAVSIPKSDVDDDKTGQAATIGSQLAEQLGRYPARLVEDLLINGTTNTAYDGVAFFSDVSSPRVNDNLLAGTGTTVSALMTDLASAEAAMMGFKNDKGEYLNIVPDLIVCGPSLARNMKTAVMSIADPSASGGVNTYNPFYGQYRVIVSAKIGADDANDFYVMSTQGILKPFIAQNRQNPQVDVEDRPSVPTYGIVAHSRGNVGYGLPHLAVKVVES